jgi:hypothetical protein
MHAIAETADGGLPSQRTCGTSEAASASRQPVPGPRGIPALAGSPSVGPRSDLEIIMDITSHVPTGPKSTWVDQANNMAAQGYPAVADKLPDLVAWLQDTNWPGAREITEFLLKIGKPVIPHVKSVLQGKDRMWQYWVLYSLVDKWPRDYVAQLEDDLTKLIRQPDAEEVDIAALRQLAKHHLGDPDYVKRAIAHKQESYRDLLVELEEMEQFLRERN